MSLIYNQLKKAAVSYLTIPHELFFCLAVLKSEGDVQRADCLENLHDESRGLRIKKFENQCHHRTGHREDLGKVTQTAQLIFNLATEYIFVKDVL